jgi:hypothetical protein
METENPNECATVNLKVCKRRETRILSDPSHEKSLALDTTHVPSELSQHYKHAEL